jgi:hypothetical protein
MKKRLKTFGIATLLDDRVSKQCATCGALLNALKIFFAIETNVKIRSDSLHESKAGARARATS